MKKVFSFILVALTLLSCVIFSACGDKYKNLKMRVMSQDGEMIEKIDFSIDNGIVEKQTIEILFSGVDKGDIGQIKVSSYPVKLIEDSNYRYDGKSCFVDILPIRSTKNQDAKLIIKHLSSGKQLNIGLNIDEKANSIQVNDQTYIISIPELEKDENEEYILNKHKLDLSQVSLLSPETSTDRVYFKFANTTPVINGVTPTKLEEEKYSKIEWGEEQAYDIFTGFEVNGQIDNNLEIEVYPVTIYRNEINIVGDKPIKIKFKRVLNQENVRLEAIKPNCEELDVNQLEVIANDNSLQTMILGFYYITKDESGKEVKTKLIETDFLDMYEIVPNVGVDCPVNIFEDANKDIVVELAIKTENYEFAEIKLVPKNYAGDFQEVVKTVQVKGELKANGISVVKNGKDVENQETYEFDIFNYYSEGNSLGTKLNFKPYANSYEPVNSKLNQMQILIDPEIFYINQKDYVLYKDATFTEKFAGDKVNVTSNDGEHTSTVCSKKYSMVFHKFGSPMKFYYNAEEHKIISEQITSLDDVYVKYDHNTDKTDEPSLEFSVRTVNNAFKKIEIVNPEGGETTYTYEYPNWEDLDPTSIDLNFDRQEGVVSMDLVVGTAKQGQGEMEYTEEDSPLKNIYLERDLEQDAGTTQFYYIIPKEASVLGVMGKLSFVEFTVEVKPLFANCERPLMVKNNVDNENEQQSIMFSYSDSDRHHVVQFVYDENTNIGEYEIIFKQGDNIKSTAKIFVYERLKNVTIDNIELEDSEYLIKNYIGKNENNEDVYKYEDYNDIDYIVAEGEELKISVVNLPQSVLDSGVISSYKFDITYVGLNYAPEELLAKQSDHISVMKVGENYAKLTFKKGTFENNLKKFVNIRVTLQQQKINLNGVIEDSFDEYVDIDLTFFIYKKITQEAISLNRTNALVYYEDTLGELYKDLSKTDIKIEMSDKELENYHTGVVWIDMDNPTEELFKNKFETGELSFKASELNSSSRQKTYVARITQFNKTLELRCVVDIKSATLTEKLVIKSNVEIDANNEYYINLKVGEEYQVVAENISSLGFVTFPETIIQVCDASGNALKAQKYFEIDQDKNKIKLTSMPEADEGGFKLVVFAKDVLRYYPYGDGAGYDNPENFIIDGDNNNLKKYKNAHFTMIIKLSDGTEENPYLIKSSDDFWGIDDESEFKKSDVWWELQNNITLVADPKGVNQIIEFNGNIKTLDNKQLTINNVKLTDKSLFKNFGLNKGKGAVALNQDPDTEPSKIKNLTFVVDYNNAVVNDTLFGVFAENNGILEDVSVRVSGNITVYGNPTHTLSFGCLVGCNNNEIIYKSTAGVNGQITINAERGANVNVGGLVGENKGIIKGYLPEAQGEIHAGTDNWIVFESSEGRQGALAEITITTSGLGQRSCIGGLVGYNTGAISNGFVNATINAPTVSNVGGVIGSNVCQENWGKMANFTVNNMGGIGINVDVLSDGYDKSLTIYNIKSSSTINANKNVGGITGSDNNGLYIDCDFQILPHTNGNLEQVSLVGESNVGGIAGTSIGGKFFYCSTMSYRWVYDNLKEKPLEVINSSVEDIKGGNYVAGIVGGATSSVDKNVIIAYSSVNAYLKATGSNNNIAGIVNNESVNSNDPTIVFSAYFIGRLDGNVTYDERGKHSDEEYGLCISNKSKDPTILFDKVYSINLETSEVKSGSYSGGGPLSYESNLGLPYWAISEGINGQYCYISIKETGTKPIFDVAPKNIEVEVNPDYAAKNVDGVTIYDVLFLDYYDFSQNTDLTEAQLLELDKCYNRDKSENKNLKNLFKYNITPYNLGVIAIKVESSNSKIVKVTQDGYLQVMGVGEECELTFSSVLKPDVKTSITVFVDYPIGDQFHITTNRSDKDSIVSTNEENISKIAVGFSKQYYVLTEGYIEHGIDGAEIANGNKYYYRTQDNPHLEISVPKDPDADWENYLEITGTINGVNRDIVDIKNNTPFVIKVNTMLENKMFTITAKPYKEVNEYKIYYKHGNDVVETEFDLKTAVGPSNVAFSFDDAIIYPNDLVQIFAHISTDESLLEEDVFNMLFIANTNPYTFEIVEENDKSRVFKITRSEMVNGDEVVYYYGKLTITIVDLGLNEDDELEGNVQTVEFSIEYERAKESDQAEISSQSDETPAELTSELNFTLKIETNYGEDENKKNEAWSNFTLIPQRINSFDIKNYYYKNINQTEKELVKENILKSNASGRIQIDLVPDNGYFSYLEISDITGDQEVLFTQIKALDDESMINNKDELSSDKKGIVLRAVDGETSLFVKTQIDKSYNSKIHTYELRAYSAEGKLLYSQRHYVDVKMLPNIIMSYLKPDGSTNNVAVADPVGTEKSSQTALLAHGVDAEFRIKVQNSNTELQPKITSSDGGELADKYEWVQDVNEYYVLKRKPLEKGEGIGADAEKDITITLTTRYEHENGDVDIAECSFTFTIVEFVIHDISVNNSLVTTKGENEISGYVGKDVSLEFYFGKNDISYYDETAQGNPYWDTEYKISTISQTNNETLQSIKNILEKLNSRENAKVYENNSWSNYLKLINETGEKVDLDSYNTLKTEEEISKSKLEVGFEVKVSSSGGSRLWEIQMIDNLENQRYSIAKTYNLNFNKATAWYDPVVILNEQDFLEMESGTSYILANDLVFKNYIPVNLNLLEFDGNGRKITIKSFAPFVEEEIKAGLFAQVYENMIVKNVVVKYDGFNTTNYYYDLCNGEANYTSAKFGGIAAINSGIITNCHVEGSVKFRASIIEQKKVEGSGNYQTNMFIAGLVAENLRTGYITNSTTQLDIESQSNIGGLVYNNQGKIASSGVVDVKIYTYNSQLENTIVIKVAGFAVENTGEISMSYMKLRMPEKTISAKDISAGFVYTNSGKVYDCYVQMEKVGFNNNVFAGFVYTNTGSVERAFTYINKGVLKNSSDALFAPKETEGIKDCIEFVSKTYNNGIESGLVQKLADEIMQKNIYLENNFAFGDNISAVWTIESGAMPTLVSETEINKYNGGKSEDGILSFFGPEIVIDDKTGVEEKKYKVNIANYGTKENPYIIYSAVDVKDESGNIILQNSWSIFTGEIKNILDGTTHEVKNHYFRIVKDIDFTMVGNNPVTYKHSFSGNIQGNNMLLKNIMIYSVQEQESIGLFKELKGSDSSGVQNAVRNLKLTTSSVWASKTQAVGLLAGLIENFNLYNITIDSENVIMVGGNAVGGVAGVVRGKFDIDSLSSNVGVNSNRATGLGYHSIYMSKNNKSSISENLKDVYYAGSVVGILDAYDRSLYNINTENGREITKDYYQVKNISVSGNLILLGDIVGAAFGFVGERVYVSRININISGELSGYQYSAGAVGENRGVINNKINSSTNGQITLGEGMFVNSSNVSAGAVGLNIGGLVMNVEVVGDIKLSGSKMAGGIVGKNINGVISNTYYEGEIFAYIVGGVASVDYTSAMYTGKSNGSGSISLQNKLNRYLLTSARVNYKDNNEEIENYENVSLAGKTLKYLTDNIKKFYVYRKTDIENEGDTDDYTVEAVKLLGLIVGLTGYSDDAELPDQVIKYDNTNLDLSGENPRGKLTLNAKDSGTPFKKEIIESADLLSTGNPITINKEFYVLEIGVGDFEMFLVGSFSRTADLWNREYCQNSIMLIKK